MAYSKGGARCAGAAFAVTTTPRHDPAVLFLSAASPGAVLRFLERRQRRGGAGDAMPPPLALLLSDAVGLEHVRLLTTEGGGADTSTWLQEQAAPLSLALDTRVTLLVLPRRGESAWSFVIWAGGAEIERGGGGGEEESEPRRRIPLWERLPGARRSLPPEAAWAQKRGLPLDRLTAPVFDYVTVAQLDQRSLLVEDSPRLYRFPLPAA